MAGGEWAVLRQALERAVRDLSGYTRRELVDLCPQLGLGALPEESSKWKSLEACLKALPDGDLPYIGQRLLDAGLTMVGQAHRFALEDALWAVQPEVEIPGRVRREVARAVDIGALVFRVDRFERLLEQFFVLDTDPVAVFTGRDTGLRAQITRHVFRNPDWSTEDLFEALGAFDTGHGRFGRLLESLVSSVAVPDVEAQRRIVALANPALSEAGVRLVETDPVDGYPCFQLRGPAHGPGRRPKNLIFASSRKPDIRFLSAIDNDIEVLGNADERLVYDRPIGHEGLRWQDLQTWWQDTQGMSDDTEAKTSLYARLLACQPAADASPQRHLFRLYHEIYRSRVRALPALLPEVWLHWDPKTVRQRGPEALLRHRMDFLMLLPHGRRVVLEVDGAHHHRTAAAYADTVRGDRELKLTGADVYRFGAAELTDLPQARLVVEAFFTDLFDAYEIQFPHDPR
jgi:hypothetical protein